MDLRPSAVLLSDFQDVQDDCQRLAQVGKRNQAVSTEDGLEPIHLWSQHELLRADEYVRLYEAQQPESCAWWDLVVHLGDDPRTGWRTWSCKSGKIPTLRRSSGLMALPAAHRHLTMRELYAAMGFPTTVALASASRTAVYEPFRADLTYRQAGQALGNSQVVPQVGCTTACILACCKYSAKYRAASGF